MVQGQELFDREYYANNYRDYERQNPPQKMRHYCKVVQNAVPHRKGMRILDIGCAFGKFIASLDSGWEPYGIDTSDYAIRKARQRVALGRFEVVQDGNIPFKEPFDIITAWDVLEHIPALEGIAQQVTEHLVADGAFIFVVPVYDGPLGPLVWALDGDPTHVHRVSRQFWLDWAHSNFQVQKWWGIVRFLFPGGYYLHWPTERFRRFAPAIAVVATRKR